MSQLRAVGPEYPETHSPATALLPAAALGQLALFSCPALQKISATSVLKNIVHDD